MRWMRTLLALCIAASAFVGTAIAGQVANGDFETGDFTGWTADPNWVIVDNTAGYYSGWQGEYWAWSGGKGEPALGKLRSKPFTLDKDGVRMLISGWNSIGGAGQPRKWNYVTLNSADGKEIDRVYAPNTTKFVPVILDGSGHRGESVYVEAVDDADQPTYSMLCIDDVRTTELPPDVNKPLPPLPRINQRESVTLEDDRYLVVVNRTNGAVARIRDKKGGLELIREPRLAGNFRFSLPIPGKEPWQELEANYVTGTDEKPTSIETTPRGLKVTWKGPFKSSIGGISNVSAVMTIDLTDDGILFTLKLDNRTPYQIGEVYFPMIGGLQGLGTKVGHLKTTELVRPAANSATSSDIFRVFTNMSPFGDQGPEQFYSYPKDMPEPWVELYAPKLKRSVYIGAQDPADRPKVVHLELFPDSSGTPRDDGNWPRPEELNGLPVGVTLSFVDFPNSPAGRLYEAAPVLVRFHDGGWREKEGN